MSKLYSLMDLHEIIVRDDDGEEYEEAYEKDLPHHDIIAKEICDSWNEMKMEKYFYGTLKDKIKSAKMRCYRDKTNGKTIAKITIEGIPGFRFGSVRRAMVFDQIESQMSDGWGEGFFGCMFTAPDGTKFFVD